MFFLEPCMLYFTKESLKFPLTFAISPITQVYPALLHKKMYNSKACIWVQDLWPESVSSAGKIQSVFVIKMLNKMVQLIYKSSDKILIQSEAFYKSVINNNVEFDKIRYIPNWAEDSIHKHRLCQY